MYELPSLPTPTSFGHIRHTFRAFNNFFSSSGGCSLKSWQKQTNEKIKTNIHSIRTHQRHAIVSIFTDIMAHRRNACWRKWKRIEWVRIRILFIYFHVVVFSRYSVHFSLTGLCHQPHCRQFTIQYSRGICTFGETEYTLPWKVHARTRIFVRFVIYKCCIAYTLHTHVYRLLLRIRMVRIMLEGEA